MISKILQILSLQPVFFFSITRTFFSHSRSEQFSKQNTISIFCKIDIELATGPTKIVSFFYWFLSIKRTAIQIRNKCLYYQNKLLETKYHMTIILIFLFFLPDCPKPDYIGDWFCDDITNIPECNFDGGDCCHVDSFTFSCDFCICYMHNLTTSTNTNASKFTMWPEPF